MSSPAERRVELAGALAVLEARLVDACANAGRRRSDVVLIAVTKTRPASDVALLRELGILDVGESKDQEAAVKAVQVPGLRWHFVGRLQRNKTRSVAGYAHAVHSLDRLPLVAALSDGSVRAGRVVDALLQVSLDGDPRRGGAPADSLPALAEATAGAAGLRLAGLMAVSPQGTTPERAFADLAVLAERLQTEHPDATAVSAGMSSDLEAAVAAGATHVRVGTALLGQRPSRSG